MKKYEGLFILNTAGKEENVKEMIDKLSEEITREGGKVETVQKMDKRQFSRVADKKHTAGFYVNFIFEAEPQLVNTLRSRFVMNEDVFRGLRDAAVIPWPLSICVPVSPRSSGRGPYRLLRQRVLEHSAQPRLPGLRAKAEWSFPRALSMCNPHHDADATALRALRES